MFSSKSLRPSTSPFRSRKSSAPSPTFPQLKRPPTPSSSKSSYKPPSPVSPPANTTTTQFTTHTRSIDHFPPDSSKAKENVTVTVRFRPLSGREITKGDEIAWYADGDYIVRNEYDSSVAYGFDRVFGPATTTRNVYDVAAQHVVKGAMQGINGTVFAYGVTSSGKTHTMHGEQKSPGIIPLAVKDVFGIIQETPGREFLLRVSYLEIYNEVINDLLDPTGQNLRIREDAQGVYVESIKEEVVLSPAHALSLIAAGEEHRHVGSNNVNLLSSRSHTIFTLTIESSPCAENGEENVTLSQLHLIDLAGSESSKTETTGLRRKEGSYINKSLLTLGTVISKLTDDKATHIPYRDSKLTRLLQSSLSGHGRVSLICTVTPASSNSEETHNTLKFANRSKHVETQASQNKIVDEKSLIKKYQREIASLKQELQQLKRGMMSPNQEDLVNLKQQLEAGKVKLQSRLEEEEQAKAALLGRIQRLTKLILVSTKSTTPTNVHGKSGLRRRHSFGEDELAYLPDRKREHIIDDDTRSTDSETSTGGRSDNPNIDELVKDFKRNSRRGMLGWFKVKKPENLLVSSSNDFESSEVDSLASSLSQHTVTYRNLKDGRISVGRKDNSAFGSFPERTQAGDLFSAAIGGLHLHPTGSTITDQMDLFREQMRLLAGEVALCTSSLKRLSEQATKNPEDVNHQDQMLKLKNEIKEKKHQMRVLEQRMMRSVEITPHISNSTEMSQAFFKLTTQLNEKIFELEIKSADNRVLQEQLQLKMSENAEMHNTIVLLRQELDALSDESSRYPQLSNHDENENKGNEDFDSYDTIADENTPTSVVSLNRALTSEDSKEWNSEAFQNSQLLIQAAELESLKEEKAGLEVHNQKLAVEASYAKELASAAAAELQNLAEEVQKLSYENGKLTADLASSGRAKSFQKPLSFDMKQTGGQCVECLNKPDGSFLVEELRQELNARHKREASLVVALSERDKIEGELRKRYEEVKKHEKDLEYELANAWLLVAKLRRQGNNNTEDASPGYACDLQRITGGSFSNMEQMETCEEGDKTRESVQLSEFEELKCHYNAERRRCDELESLVLRLKGDDIGGLDLKTLEELQNFHVEAITKICHAKCMNHVSSQPFLCSAYY
ncbi:OLC1v1016302C1 [Oldenlandia corymbosa var. corymbosa]|uniref:OLC1v1016302C1 n=1 Tax=Oldenlandia corymbosa var. corymbosa TaxID=529605 RepID=A0AAV1E533_OLDCO|nr:OLC1v1016302C1 [Oldenlandia corymbosa var. corymbosa]